MSSLAGALIPSDIHQHHHHGSSIADEDDDDLESVQPNLNNNQFPEDEDKDEDVNDLFGEDEDVNMVEHEPISSAPSEPTDHKDRLSSPERRHREELEYAEEDEPETVVEHRLEADVAIPNIPVPRTSDGSYWVIRMPNFIKVDSKPFHPDTYVGPEHEDEDSHHSESLREKSMTIKLKVENTVRWRWAKDHFGQDRRQSNSRIVKWSDGSLSLQLGKELFDITQSIDNSAANPRHAASQSHSSHHPPSLSQSQSQSALSGGAGHGLTYLVAQHKRAEILQCEALITGYMSLRPTGMQSETHRMLVRAVGQKHSRVARLRMAPEPTTDPEREKLELAKAVARKPRKSRAGGEDAGFGVTRRRRSGYTRKRTGDDVWSDDEDEDGGGFGRGGSEDEYGDDAPGGRKSMVKRKSKAADESRKGPGEYQTDDFLVADSDEDEHFGEDGGLRRRKRKRVSRGGDGDAEEDDLERLEAQISQNEAQERKRRLREGDHAPDGGAAQEDAGEDAMDVESEDDDDDFGVRRGRVSGGRKRRALVQEDEDD